jgi:hypothetical protein
MIIPCWCDNYAGQAAAASGSHVQPKTVEGAPTYSQVVFCSSENGVRQWGLQRDQKLQRRLRAPLASKPMNEPADQGGQPANFPFLVTLGDPFSVETVELATAALIAAVSFLPQLLSHPEPPRPYPTAYSYQPLEMALGTAGGAIRSGARAVFPSGDMPVLYRRWASCPSYIQVNGAARPPSAYRIVDAVEFHTKALAALGYGGEGAGGASNGRGGYKSAMETRTLVAHKYVLLMSVLLMSWMRWF